MHICISLAFVFASNKMASFEAQTSNANANSEDPNRVDMCGIANQMLLQFIDDLIFGEVLLAHYESRSVAAEEGEQGIGVDVVGLQLNKPPEVTCECPECGYKIAASRFAPHLAKCLGKGRASSRAASQRISGESCSYNTEDVAGAAEKDDYYEVEIESDEEWLPKKCDGKKRRGKVEPRNTYVGNRKDSRQAYEGMTSANKEMLLQRICGVVSSQTGRYCMRSMKCPHHSKEERSAIRGIVLDHFAQPEVNSSIDVMGAAAYAEGTAKILPEFEL